MNKLLHYPHLFLTDAAGAFITFVLLWQVFPVLFPHSAIPDKILHLLADLAAVYAMAGAIMYFHTPFRKPRSFYVLAIANICYVLLTLYLLYPLRWALTFPEGSYFLGEMFIILLLVFCEIRNARRNYPNGYRD